MEQNTVSSTQLFFNLPFPDAFQGKLMNKMLRLVKSNLTAIMRQKIDTEKQKSIVLLSSS